MRGWGARPSRTGVGSEGAGVAPHLEDRSPEVVVCVPAHGVMGLRQRPEKQCRLQPVRMDLLGRLMLTNWRMSRYLDFAWAGRSSSGRTQRWSVTSKSSGARLGIVSWYGPWRQYVIEPEPGCVFNNGCLNDISAFLTEMNENQRRVPQAESSS